MATGIVDEFIDWFHARGEFYSKLPVRYYVDGEPYFSSGIAECSLRDYLRVKRENATIAAGQRELFNVRGD